MLLARTIPLVAVALFGTEVAYSPRDTPRVLRLPHGTIEVASYGLVEVAPEDSPLMTTLHVRLALHNSNDEVPWTMDLADTTLALGDARLHPTLVNSDLGTLPIVIVDRTSSATVDLYFAVPPRAPDGFAVTWAVTTSAGVLRERTSFAVDRSTTPRRGIRLLLGAGKRWWFDPKYEWTAYRHRPGAITTKPPTHVFIIP